MLPTAIHLNSQTADPSFRPRARASLPECAAASARLDMVKVGISPNYPFTAWAAPLLGQVLPQAMPGIRLHILVLQEYPEIGMALLPVDLVGMLPAEGDNRRRTDPWSRWGSLRIYLPVGRFAEQTPLKPSAVRLRH